MVAERNCILYVITINFSLKIIYKLNIILFMKGVHYKLRLNNYFTDLIITKLKGGIVTG